jgi:hypothetical protein
MKLEEKYQELKTTIDELGTAYRESDSVSGRQELSTQIRDRQIELQDLLSKGAKSCPDGDDHRVIGMLKCPEHWDSNVGMVIPDVFEVGCVVCPPVLIPFDEKEHRIGIDHPTEKDAGGNARKVVRWSHSARGWSPKEAVDKWNDGDWLVDTKKDQVPTTAIFNS